MVLVILLEMTSPTRSLRLPRAAGVAVEGVVASAIQSYLCRFFTQHRDPGLDPRDVPPQRAQPRRFFQPRAGLLQTEVKNFLPQIPAVSQQFGQRLFLEIFSLGLFHSRSAARLVPRNEFR